MLPSCATTARRGTVARFRASQRGQQLASRTAKLPQANEFLFLHAIRMNAALDLIQSPAQSCIACCVSLL